MHNFTFREHEFQDLRLRRNTDEHQSPCLDHPTPVSKSLRRRHRNVSVAPAGKKKKFCTRRERRCFQTTIGAMAPTTSRARVSNLLKRGVPSPVTGSHPLAAVYPNGTVLPPLEMALVP